MKIQRLFGIPTWKGVSYFLTSLVIFLFTFTEGSMLLGVASLIALSLFIVSMLLARNNITGLEIINIEIVPAPAETRTQLKITIANSTQQTKYDFYIKFHLKLKETSLHYKIPHTLKIDKVNPGVSGFEFPVELIKRGHFLIESLSFITYFPFGWLRIWQRIEKPINFWIYPYSENHTKIIQHNFLNSSDGDFKGHRLAPGEFNGIDWKIWAKKRLLMRKEFQEKTEQPLVIIWDQLEALTTEQRLSQLCYEIYDWKLGLLEIRFPKETLRIKNNLDKNIALQKLAIFKNEV